MDLYRNEISTLGLDIGTSMIKAVLMKKRGKKSSIENFAIQPVDEGVMQGGEIKNPSQLAQLARRAVNRCSPGMRDVIVALPGSAVLSEVLTIDLKPAKELKEAVMVEAQRISPFDVSEVEISYSVLEKDETSKKMKVLMAAAKHDIILSYVDFLNEAGLRPVILDVDIFALVNTFCINHLEEKNKTGVILQIGKDTTTGVFIHEGRYHSKRDISVNGSRFERELEQAGGYDKETLQNIISGYVNSSVKSEKVAHALNTAGNGFADAVEVAASYFQSSDDVGKLDLIVLSGGYAWMPGLANILEMRTGAEVMVMNPLKRINYSSKLMNDRGPEKTSSILSVAIGLAMRDI